MKKLFFGSAVVLFFSTCFNNVIAGPCWSYEDQPNLGSPTAFEFSPDAIGNHGLDYEVKNLGLWPVTVRVFWQSNTYPGWKQFRELMDPQEFIWCISQSDDNVRYRIEFWTNSSTATFDVLFCKDWWFF